MGSAGGPAHPREMALTFAPAIAPDLAPVFAPADHLSGWFVDGDASTRWDDWLDDDLDLGLDLDAPYDPDDLDRLP
jgi:hypothetical protein